MGFRSLSSVIVNTRRTLNRKEQLRHRAVSLRQHGFLVHLAAVRYLGFVINVQQYSDVIVNLRRLFSVFCRDMSVFRTRFSANCSGLVVANLLTKPFDTHCYHIGTAIKHPVPDRVKPSFVNFDI